MKNTKIIIALFFCLISATNWAQLAMGKWRTHLAYNSVTQIAQSDSKIYAVSDGALYSVDKTDEVLEFYSKVSGLNGANISRIEYDDVTKQLLVIYANGNMDVLATGGVTNIPDLYNKQMSASKAVNQIQFYGGKAYLSCDFGILVLNMQKKEVADTYYIGANASEVKVLKTTVHNGSIYALSAATIYKASITEPSLVNYQFWTSIAGMPGSGDFQSISSFENQLVLLRGGKLYKQDSNSIWTALLPTVTATNFTVSNGSLNVFEANKVYLIDKLFNTVEVSDIGTLTDAEYDLENNTYWFAANSLGVASYRVGTTPKYFKPVGPALNSPWDLKFAGEKLFVTAGRPSTGEFMDGILMIYEGGTWTNISGQSAIRPITQLDAMNFMNVAVDPLDDKHFFVTSFGTGLFEFRNNIFSKLHNHTNSTLQTHRLAPNNPFYYTWLDGIIYDQDANLLVFNCAADAKIKILTKEAKWTEIKTLEIPDDMFGKILINKQNQNHKWITTFSKGQITVIDDKGTLTDSDDYKKVFTSFADPDNVGSNLIHTKEYCIAQDKNGVVWLGTEQGPLLFNNPSRAFDNDFSCSRVKIPRNDGTNLADYLLVTEKIKSIAIDGANRKWLGTEASGVYLMSENGQETIKHFTTSNSPLLSNDILSIAINPISGEVFFGTGQGILSYQGDASDAGDLFGDVHAYPNPVRENYVGVITITGLVENTQVKITDLNGNLICQTVSNGSIATWDGKDVHGRKVSTGIYLAVCASADGLQSSITKIMVIN